MKAYIWKNWMGMWTLRLVGQTNGLGVGFNFPTFERAVQRLPAIWKVYEGKTF